MGMTLSSMLDFSAQKYSQREAVLFEDSRATYQQLNDRVCKRADVLIKLGVKKGDHVGTLFFNCMEAIESFFAVWRIGAVLVPLNFRLSPDELAYMVNQSDLSTLIFQDQLADSVKGFRSKTPQIERFCYVGKACPSEFIDFESAVGEVARPLTLPEVKEEDLATIIYTAGTTGKPKGVVATHHQWMWSLVNMAASFQVTTPIKSLTVYPFFHAAAFGNLLTGLFLGSSLFIMAGFDPQKLLERVQTERINRLGNPPTVYNMIIHVPEIEQYDLSSIKYLMSGSEVMPDKIRNRLKRTFPGAGIYDYYGMTETCGLQAYRSAEFTEAKPYSVGLPCLTINVRVVDTQQNDVPSGETGEIVVRGPNVMQGYYKNPEKTAAAVRNGWLHTGDLGYLDEEGFLYIIERQDDMIISGGENIYPKEVEDALYRHPKINEVAVFGLPDETWGEKVSAAVVLKQGQEMSSEEVIEFCSDKLAGYKKPKHVNFMNTLPRSIIGKVLRRELKQQFNKD